MTDAFYKEGAPWVVVHERPPQRGLGVDWGVARGQRAGAVAEVDVPDQAAAGHELADT